MSDWTAHAAELARSIGAVAGIHDRRWLAAVERVPRHVFVPRWYERRPTGWVAMTTAAPDAAGRHPVAGPAVDPAADDATAGRQAGAGPAADPASGDPAVSRHADPAAGSTATDPTAGRRPGVEPAAESAADPADPAADAPTDPGVVTDAGLAGAYRDEALVTALLPDGHGGLAAVSSSTQPSLMVGMLDALDLRDHPRVLEIGTGTGYNAALMCSVLGDAAVHSVDVDPALVATARTRLDSLGHHPVLAAGDGRAGLPSHAPYDRIIATCAFPEVPWAWAEQLVADGLLLVDVKVGLLAGNLALLRRAPDRLEGHFLPSWAGFMAVRDRDRPPAWQEADPPVGPAAGETETAVDPHPLAASVPWFLAQIGPPPVVTFRRFGPQLAGGRFVAADGAWCSVSPPDHRSRRTVTWGGPRRLWDDVERAHALWRAHRRPGWGRLGLTVAPDRSHTVWLDRPDAPLARW